MKIQKIHSWDNITIDRARELQENLSERIIVAGGPEKVRTIAAGDLAFSNDGTAYAAIVLLAYPEFEMLEIHTGTEHVRFPYIPGYLTFREAPLLLKLFKELSKTPDLVMLDGQGIAHPRKLGLGAHIGIFLNVPTIGVAKSRLIGKYIVPEQQKGAWSWLTYHGEKIGMVIRTRDNVKPIFVSPGHLIDYNNCLKWTMRCSLKYRIPEPTRQAHNEVTKFKKSILTK